MTTYPTPSGDAPVGGDAETALNVVVVTGASGVVGRGVLTELLSRPGYEVRVLSRDPDQFRPEVAAGIKVAGYDDLDEILTGAHSVLHLAARNNDQGGTAADFERDNCEWACELAEAAARRGVKRFVFATTTKALAGKGADSYGLSKANAEYRLLSLADRSSLEVALVRLGPVHGPGSKGKVRFLENMPVALRGVAARLLRSLLPIVSVDVAAKGLVSMLEDGSGRVELCLSDPLDRWSPYWPFAFAVNGLFVLAVPTVLAIPTAGSAAAVALDSPGGVFFVQRRVGYRQRPFHCRKFRTMRTDAPVAGTHEVGRNYVTGVGEVLRKFKLDELPQAVNVFKREMNVIGPRPCLESQSELIAERARYGVFDTRPGVTGLGQVAGVDMSQPKKLAIFDHRYAAFRSIAWDITIAVKTILGGGFGDPVGDSDEQDDHSTADTANDGVNTGPQSNLG
jgi:lipopolysaccharide/colanic/teichoic acid biosynthesis glycosyltransferase